MHADANPQAVPSKLAIEWKEAWGDFSEAVNENDDTKIKPAKEKLFKVIGKMELQNKFSSN